MKSLAEQFAPQVVTWRRDFHAHPELSNREQRTAQTVVDILREIGITESRPEWRITALSL